MVHMMQIQSQRMSLLGKDMAAQSVMRPQRDQVLHLHVHDEDFAYLQTQNVSQIVCAT